MKYFSFAAALLLLPALAGCPASDSEPTPVAAAPTAAAAPATTTTTTTNVAKIEPTPELDSSSPEVEAFSEALKPAHDLIDQAEDALYDYKTGDSKAMDADARAEARRLFEQAEPILDKITVPPVLVARGAGDYMSALKAAVIKAAQALRTLDVGVPANNTAIIQQASDELDESITYFKRADEKLKSFVPTFDFGFHSSSK